MTQQNSPPEPVGIILDGQIQVGTFDDVTANGPLRELKNVLIHSNYLDVANGQTKRDLTLLYVMRVDGSYVLIDEVGYGIVYASSWWSSEPFTNTDSATFKQAPEKSNAN